MAHPPLTASFTMAASFELFMAPLLLLICVALVLFGIFCAQVYAYWTTFAHDTSTIRALVVALTILEVTHSMLCMYMLYEYFIVDIGDPLALDTVIWSPGDDNEATVLVEMLIVTLSQGFSILRIWQLSRGNIYSTLIAGVLLFLRVGFGIATASFLFVYHTWTEFRTHSGSFATLNCGLSLAALLDLTTTALLTYYLRRHRTSFKRTQYIIQKLIFYTVNTGALTMVFSVVTVFLFSFLDTSLMFGGMVEIISKLYANSTLALLNARQSIRTHDTGPDADRFNSIPLEIRGRGANPEALPSQKFTEMQINIFKEVSTSGDNSHPSGTACGGNIDSKDIYSLA